MIDWNDLRYFLAAVQAGTYSGASKKLRVDRTTVGRRVDELEKSLGVALFEQTASGYHPTTAGLQALQVAQRIESEVVSLVDALDNAKQAIQGHLRLAFSVELGEELMQEVTAFLQRHSDIQAEIINVSDPVAALTHRKADVALCVVHSKPDHLIGPLLGHLQFGIYGSSKYLKQVPMEEKLQSHRWVGWNEELSASALARWMAINLPDQILRGTRVNSWTALKSAVLSGLGVSAMWCAFADQERRLIRIRDPLPDQSLGLWLLALEDIPIDACKKAAFEFLEPRLKRRLQQLI